MPRPAWIFASVALLLTTPVLAAGTIDGWDGYKFGMSPDAARAVPGIAFGPFVPKNLMNENFGAMSAKKAVLNGRTYTIDLFFDTAQKLNRAYLENQVNVPRPDCEKRFLDLVTLMEKSYGRSLAVDPQHPRSDGDTPPMSLVWKKQGASSYQLSTVFLADETVSAWKSRNVQGRNYLDIAAAWSGKRDSAQNACVTSLDFNTR